MAASSTLDSPLTPAEAWSLRESQIRAVPEQELIPLNVEVVGASAVILGALSSLAPLRAQILELPGQSAEQLDSLRELALALLHIDSVHQQAVMPTNDIPALAEQCSQLKELFIADFRILTLRKVIDPARIANLRNLVGARNLASDLLDLATVFQQNWPSISSFTSIRRHEVDDALELAVKTLAEVAAREQGPINTTESAPLRNRAFTALMSAYGNVRRAVLYLRDREGDAAQIAPSAYVNRASPRRTTDTRESKQPATVEPATPAKPAVVAPLMVTGIQPQTVPGGPGGSPFIR